MVIKLSSDKTFVYIFPKPTSDKGLIKLTYETKEVYTDVIKGKCIYNLPTDRGELLGYEWVIKKEKNGTDTGNTTQ